jgi:RNA polymerase sigma-70 factor (ECF subfamily)
MTVSFIQSLGLTRKVRSREAVADFLNDERPWMYRLALSVVGRRDLAEDVVQDVQLRCWKNRHKLTEVVELKAWTRTVVVRCSIDALRRATYEVPEEQVAPGQPDEDVHVRAVLQQLAPDQRVVLALTYFERMSYAEIAETLGIPEGTVASRLHTAKATFRAAWEAK